ncbi:hypothetical protein DTO271D3_5748 [Paecilomyces variotii]|nr:hypothetical protein DTO169C6_8547 [Paecilomyces variotii]KAJ9240868.1 hypothetical protein DTO169E5_3785 [Paecilomyces variotii]KAJ9251577.1 hypothetical protein DTO207G8_5257 [Paecilomyces variotii]KAJ9314060.1 hypothetical protein DTO271D3_5748 [Paecilomyces variotii]KAJ9383910.1 hypothetical protein DTO063F5_5014 [Paecilomyces variotii]
MADYKKILRSSHFTFLVGQEQTPLTIHAAIVHNLSEPLYTLINNGLMKESISRVATLDDVETETFIAFCEYAYTGAYVTPDRKPSDISEDEPEPEPSNNQESFNHDYIEPTMEPPLDFAPPPQPEEDAWDAWPSTTKKSKRNKKRMNRDEAKADAEPEPEPMQVNNVVYPYERLWRHFRLRMLRIYVFATKYLVEQLRQQCLKSLHRDLRRFSLNRESASLVLDLLDFTYANTGRYEPGGKSPLRDLVIHYIACEARTLGDNERFTEILDSNAEMGSDLVAKLVR